MVAKTSSLETLSCLISLIAKGRLQAKTHKATKLWYQTTFQSASFLTALTPVTPTVRKAYDSTAPSIVHALQEYVKSV
jgi:hypothetical protein